MLRTLYRVYLIAERAGFIEALPNALPVREAGGCLLARVAPLGGGRVHLDFVPGLADRHQDNMLLCGPQRDCFAHIDFGYVAGQRPWFDANPLPVLERCTARLGGAAGRVRRRVRPRVRRCRRAASLCVARALAEPLAPVGHPAYVAEVLATHTPQSGWRWSRRRPATSTAGSRTSTTRSRTGTRSSICSGAAIICTE